MLILKYPINFNFNFNFTFAFTFEITILTKKEKKDTYIASKDDNGI